MRSASLLLLSLLCSVQHVLSVDVALDALFDNVELSKDVLVVGSVNADLVFDIERLPKPGETLAGGGGIILAGGKGANQAVAASGLGAHVKFAGVFGSDSHGEMLREKMKNYGVDLSLSLTSDGPNGQAVILLQAGGENSIVLVPGANADWPEELPDSLAQAIDHSGCVLLQREIPNYVNVMVARRAKAAGVPVVMDMGGEDTPLPEELFSLVEYLCPNESELSRLTNMPTDNVEMVTAAAKALQAKGVKNVLVTIGEEGSLLFTEGRDEPIKQARFSVDKVVDTTGAGDCYRGNFAAAMAMGASAEEGMKIGSAASALCVQVKGAMNSMPNREEVSRKLSA